jgi:murein L,D-transpeptidase YcbB/YkuD
MRKLYLPFITVVILLALAGGSCKSYRNKHHIKHPANFLWGAVNHKSHMPFDSNLVITFYRSYPALNKYKEDLREVYRLHKYTQIWYDEHGVVEFGQTLYNKFRELNDEGISSKFPYQDKIDGIFENGKVSILSQTETDLMLTNMYLFYAENVFKGIDDTTSVALGWLLPRKQVSYEALLDSVMVDPKLLNRNDSALFIQYYKLRDVLKLYRNIEKKGGWPLIDLNPKSKAYKPGDTAKAILQIRERLFISGELKQNNKSNKYDPELLVAVKKYQKNNGFNTGKLIKPEHIMGMNIPVTERIKKIIVNMERCRWISPEISNAKTYIVVNIPAYRLDLVRDGKSELVSPVIVGKNEKKTIIFSGLMSYIVFSPYWKIPPSVMEEDVKPGLAKNKNYLIQHNMEWYKGQLRQKPGKNNSLGLVKFIFPNADDIYMHDTPAKSLFAHENRSFSHGCIRLGKPRDLAIDILKDDPAWTPKKIDAAMHAGKESTYILKKKIPVYIGYLTAWVDENGEINFYKDVYDLDGRLAELLLDGK